MSGSTRERELKLGVPDAAALAALLEAAGGERDVPVRQVNHFFDTPGRALKARSIGFRLREEGDERILTVKGPTGEAARGAAAERVELETTVEPAIAHAVIAGGSPALDLLDCLDLSAGEAQELAGAVREACADEPLAYIGNFENERTRVRTRLAGIETVLELDRTSFPGDETRYEVELELQPGQSEEALGGALHELFAATGVEPQPTTSKLSRFHQILSARG